MERAREGVAVLLGDLRHSAVVKHGCVSRRILWAYGPDEAEGEERDRFWNDIDRTLDSVGICAGCEIGDRMGRDLSDCYVVLCKVRLVGA